MSFSFSGPAFVSTTITFQNFSSNVSFSNPQSVTMQEGELVALETLMCMGDSVRITRKIQPYGSAGIDHGKVHKTHLSHEVTFTVDSIFCRICGSSNSIVWRRGPEGVNTLCNKHGLRYKKAQNISKEKSNVLFKTIYSKPQEDFSKEQKAQLDVKLEKRIKKISQYTTSRK